LIVDSKFNAKAALAGFWFRQPTDDHVSIPDGLDLLETVAFREFIKQVNQLAEFSRTGAAGFANGR
jgi:hypothetical protein